MKLSSSYILIRTNQCVCIVMNFESSKVCHHLLQDPILLHLASVRWIETESSKRGSIQMERFRIDDCLC